MFWIISTIVLLSALLLIWLYSPLKRKFFQVGGKEGVLQDLKFWLSLLHEDIVSIIITGISIFVFVFAISSKSISSKIDITLSVVITLAIPTFVGLIRKFARYGQVFEKVDNPTLLLIEELLNFLRKGNISSDNRFSVVKQFYDKYSSAFGGIVIGATEKEYMEKLNSLLIPSTEIFYATLRGGQHPRYTIGWFFEEEELSSLTRNQKIKYLRDVNEARINRKIRIVILEEKEMADFCNNKWRNTFFENSTKIQTYIVSPQVLKEKLRDANIGQTSFIMEDYAIFGEKIKIAIKHNGQNSLYLGTEKQIDDMCVPFKLAQDDTDLKAFWKMDEDKISYYDTSSGKAAQKTWDDWKKKFIDNHPKELLETIMKIYQSKHVIHGARYINFCTEDEFKQLVVTGYKQMFKKDTSYSFDIFNDVYTNIYKSNRDLNKHENKIEGLAKFQTDGITE